MFKQNRHGGELDRMRDAFPEAPRPWVDLSTGINPWSYPDQTIAVEALERLPTQSAFRTCVQALANSIGANTNSVLLGPGSEILIHLLPSMLAPQRVAILNPTYGDHHSTWRRAGREVIATDDPLSFADQVDAIVLCNPNNPDGRTFKRDALLAALDALATRSGYLIVDEAYADLTPQLSLADEAGRPGLIVLRSFGKFFGLAGVRLGALLAPKPVITAMTEILGAWPISGAALEIGRRAYEDIEWQSETRIALASARQNLDLLLQAHELIVCGGTDLFRYVQISNAHDAWTQFARNGIYLRKFADRPDRLRMGLPMDAEDFVRLKSALSLLT